MLYWLIELSDKISVLNVFRYITFRTGGAVVTALVFVFLCGPLIIDRLRVRQGKGCKERVLPLSPRLLQELHDYWLAQRANRPGHDCPWLFLGTKPNQPMNKATGQNIYYRAVKKTGYAARAGFIYCVIPSPLIASRADWS